ncbi:hypothetical protein TUM20983_00080 [Mycobacterium antarcticum]|uniref:DUF3566 domain-containing protein n=1 Tax=unclassified Mycolicibacterium TaxID=2636767 RepID=UPI00238F68EE|nr:MULTISPECIES: DUF3566 domain-containing protein [unclassified Mycolicibacterium]GLP72898.1 hypothetical protein TUM20983_00080 [Mycolicibacterium sp. TUM20983]GLP78588.1 hypothetical protein TUM20984_00080 [Mycolicibacterium sp. TUM20984]
MGSPNEPGPPRASDGTGSANGSNGAHESGPANGAPPSGEVPPWQRGAASRPRPSDGPRAGAAAGHSPGPGPAANADARLNRFIAGGPASGPTPASARETTPVREPDSAQQTRSVERPEGGRSESYASELPDLSGSAPRSTRKPAERTAVEPSARSSAPATRAQAAGRSQGPVRASMQIRRFDPWSVLKVSMVLSVALFFVWMIAVAFLYLVLGGMGVWSKLNSNVGDLLTSASGSGGELVSSGTIFGGAALIGLVNIVLLTAMATCGAFIYNLTTDLVGGIEVTLADRD